MAKEGALKGERTRLDDPQKDASQKRGEAGDEVGACSGRTEGGRFLLSGKDRFAGAERRSGVTEGGSSPRPLSRGKDRLF